MACWNDNSYFMIYQANRTVLVLWKFVKIYLKSPLPTWTVSVVLSSAFPGGQFAQCRGGHKQCWNRPVYQSSFFKGFVSPYCWLRVSLLFGLCLCCWCNAHLSHVTLFTWLLRSPLARAPYVVLFDLKPLANRRWQLADMYVCMHKKEPQKPLKSM